MILAMEQSPPKPGEKTPVFVSNKQLNKQGITSEDLAILSVGGVGAGILLLFGGKIATTALLVSVLTTGSGIILWIKMPAKIEDLPLMSSIINTLPISKEKKERILAFNWKESVEKHELIVDILVSCGVLLIFGTTLTGILAAGFTGVMVSGIIRLRNVYKRVSFRVQEGLRELT